MTTTPDNDPDNTDPTDPTEGFSSNITTTTTTTIANSRSSSSSSSDNINNTHNIDDIPSWSNHHALYRRVSELEKRYEQESNMILLQATTTTTTASASSLSVASNHVDDEEDDEDGHTDDDDDHDEDIDDNESINERGKLRNPRYALLDRHRRHLVHRRNPGRKYFPHSHRYSRRFWWTSIVFVGSIGWFFHAVFNLLNHNNIIATKGATTTYDAASFQTAAGGGGPATASSPPDVSLSVLTTKTTTKFRLQRRINDTVLMGQFNFNTTATTADTNTTTNTATATTTTTSTEVEDVVFWYNTWHECCFDNIVVRGPFSNQQLHLLRHRYNIKHAYAYGTRGHNNDNNDGCSSSPMEHLGLTLQQFSNGDNGDSSNTNNNSSTIIKGVLYVQDDLLFNITYLFPFLGGPHIVATHDVSNPRNLDVLEDTTYHNETSLLKSLSAREQRLRLRQQRKERREYISNRSYRIERDGRFFSKIDGYRTKDPTKLIQSLKPTWTHYEECLFQFLTVVGDERALPYREDTDKSWVVPPPSYGASTMLYVPTSLTDDYIEASTLLMDHDVFFECGFPKLIDMILQRHLTKTKKKNAARMYPRTRVPRVVVSDSTTDIITLSSKLADPTAISIPPCSTFLALAGRGPLQMMEQCHSDDNSKLGDVHTFKLGVNGITKIGRKHLNC